ncbi:hypothetical protein FQN50_008572 [Emmonsiellopsis sp. PD_5]|nr:hypothetical protein FQN50_008572 [Emmonsiellopsis sp. PD_5]
MPTHKLRDSELEDGWMVPGIRTLFHKLRNSQFSYLLSSLMQVFFEEVAGKRVEMKESVPLIQEAVDRAGLDTLPPLSWEGLFTDQGELVPEFLDLFFVTPERPEDYGTRHRKYLVTARHQWCTKTRGDALRSSKIQGNWRQKTRKKSKMGDGWLSTKYAYKWCESPFPDAVQQPVIIPSSIHILIPTLPTRHKNMTRPTLAGTERTVPGRGWRTLETWRIPSFPEIMDTYYKIQGLPEKPPKPLLVLIHILAGTKNHLVSFHIKVSRRFKDLENESGLAGGINFNDRILGRALFYLFVDTSRDYPDMLCSPGHEHYRAVCNHWRSLPASAILSLTTHRFIIDPEAGPNPSEQADANQHLPQSVS